ncbi:MAG: putative lipid II flippase FtsW [Candidatus Staskawiczbacteria bacterium]|nr:putative lipid II flippase FtsW [Candidatus Staskawiczbacteria bacterium]
MSKHVNYYLLGLVIFLIGFGALFLSTLSSIPSLDAFGNTNYYLFRQLIRIGIGLVACLVAFKMPLAWFKKISPWLLLANLFLLVVVFFPILGTNFWGASRWISIGGISFQPSEFLKISAILYLSALLSNKFSESTKKNWIGSAKKGLHNFNMVFLPFLLLLAIVIIILKYQRDLSTLGIVVGTLIIIYFSARTPVWHMVLSFLLAGTSAVIFIAREPYRLERLKVFLHPGTDPLGIGMQVKQSIIAVGSGGFFGKGLGMSIQKFGFLPQAMSDSIFAILGEETGIVGCVILVLLFVLFFYLGLKIANSSGDSFARLIAVGITFWITSQAFMNIASAVGLFPLSGIPLPFFSYGGSHIISELIGIGLLLNISKNG